MLLKGVVIEWQRACEKVKREQERDAAKEAHKQKFVKMSAGQQPIFWGLFLGTLFLVKKHTFLVMLVYLSSC